jgi:hypothetical protein
MIQRASISWERTCCRILMSESVEFISWCKNSGVIPGNPGSVRERDPESRCRGGFKTRPLDTGFRRYDDCDLR